eukprot:CAMPEP_0195137176 /NCGR_PEP_ID=MMETSP0448-20130528/155503_1 /TAXON_ID=66468 /ORGANISM="Heterocapsa triquestra, Strain CCMP 448" /LENGTH=48 /DNA_ID= /DNA_START= /DNA_END= /DNA_ORIENTATION=
MGSDGGDLFKAVQSALQEASGEVPVEPPPVPKQAYGQIELSEVAPLFD